MLDRDTRVLIVDDFETVRLFLRKALIQLEIQNIEEASNGKEALELMKQRAKNQQPFDLVFCDWNMPEMDGLQLLKAVRQDSMLRDVPFLMVTSEAEWGAVKESVTAGVTDYIVKPFSFNTIKAKIQNYQRNTKKAG